MFYTRIAKFISAILLFMGIIRILMGILVATSETPKMIAVRYLGSHTSAESIDQGVLSILIAIVLGVLVEISKAVHEKTQDNSNTKK